eukprot:105606_1
MVIKINLTSFIILSYYKHYTNYYYFTTTNSIISITYKFKNLFQLCIMFLLLTIIIFYYLCHTINTNFINDLYNNSLYVFCLLSNRFELYNYPFILLIINYIIQSIDIECDIPLLFFIYIIMPFNLIFNVLLSQLNMKPSHPLINPISFNKLGLFFSHSLFQKK